MSDYNLGTASGRIVVDGSGAEIGFGVAKTAAGAFFDVVKMRVNEVQQLGRRMAAAGAAGVAGFGAAIHTAADFEQSMSGVFAVANANERQMEALRQKALQLGADTVFSATESAQALEELVKAGISVKDVLNGAADATTALAAAGGTSIPEAATIAANAMNQFGLSGKNVADVADILAGVANTSAADVSTLGVSLQQAGAVANLAGLNFKDTAIALGEMADAGIQGSDAGTSLKTMLNNLIPTTTRQIDKFMELKLLTYDMKRANQVLAQEHLPLQKNIDGVYKVLGKYMEELDKGAVGTQKNAKAVQDLMLKTGALDNEFFNAQGNVKRLGQLQGTLKNAMKDMTREQKLATLETLFGADAMRASAILSNQGAKGYRQFAKDVDKTSAADVAAVRLNNMNGAMEQLKGSIQTAAITIGSIFLPAITMIIKALTWLVNAFNSLPGPIKTAIGIFAALMSVGSLVLGLFLAFLPVIIGMVANFLLLRVIKNVITGFRIFYATMRGGLGVMAATRAGVTATGNAMVTTGKRSLFAGRMMLLFGRMARAAWIMATGPIGIIVLAVLALIAVGVLLYKKWQPFHDLVDQIAAVVQGKLIVAWAALKPILIQAGEALLRVGQWAARTLLPVLKQVGEQLKGQLLDGFQQIMHAVNKSLIPALEGFDRKLHNQIIPGLQKLWVAIGPIVTVIFKLYIALQLLYVKGFLLIGKIIIAYVLPALIKFVGFLLGEVIGALADMATGMVRAWAGAVKIFNGFIKFFRGVFTGDWDRAWKGLIKIGLGFKKLLKGIFQLIFALSLRVIALGWRAIQALFDKYMGKLDDSTGNRLSGIVQWFVDAFNAIKSVVMTVVNFITGFIGAELALLQKVWNAYWGTFGPYLTAVFGLIVAIVKLFWVIIKGVFLLSLDILKQIFGAAFQWMVAATKVAFKIISTAVKIGFVILRTYFRVAFAVLRAIFGTAWHVMAAIVGAVWGVIGGKVKAGVGLVKSIVVGGWNVLKGITRAAWAVIYNAIKAALNLAVAHVTSAKDLILSVLNISDQLRAKGAALIQGLIDGITSKINDVKNAIGSVTKVIGDHLPGSPVKEGPLVKWNNGAAGKKLMGMLGTGLKDTTPVDDAMAAATAIIAGYERQLQAAALAASVSVAKSAYPTYSEERSRASSARKSTETARLVGATRGAEGTGRSRILGGTLLIDERGRAYFEGVAQDVYEENEDFKNNRDGKGRRGQ